MTEEKTSNRSSIFISGYSKDNLQISKERGILGWIQRKKELKIGDYVFIYNITDREIDTVFRIESPREDTSPIWQDEKTTGNLKYKNRWNAKLIQDDLNISINEIIAIQPFNGSSRDFNLIIRNPFPTLLNDKFNELRELLYLRSDLANSIEIERMKDNTVEIIDKNPPNYFLIQVGSPGSTSILEKGHYQHIDWNKTPRDRYHGQARVGDILLVYFGSKSKQFRMTLKKGYEINSITKDNVRFSLAEIVNLNGIKLYDIKKAIDSSRLRKEVFGKLSQQNFNIIRIEKEDWNQVLELDKELYAQRYESCKASFPDEKDRAFINRTKKTYEDFIKLYPYSANPNEIESLTQEKLFQSGDKRTLLYMVQYWGSGIGIHSGDYRENIIQNFGNFKQFLKKAVDPNLSLAQKVDLNWGSIPGLGGDKLIAKKLIHIFNLDSSLAISTPDMEEMLSNLGIDYKEVSLERFEKNYTNLTLGEKYQLLTQLLLKAKDNINKEWDTITFNTFLYKCVSPRYIKYIDKTIDLAGEKEQKEEESEINTRLSWQTERQINPWHLLSSNEIEIIVEYVLNYENKRLEIDKEIIKRIINHLVCGKNVILIGAPGTGKTDLARRLLRILGQKIVGKKEPVEAVASYEWGRYEVIGGNSLSVNQDGKNFAFHYGCVTKAIKERKLLLIDEFNRADMNKAFGEMFLAVDHGQIELRQDEKPSELYELDENESGSFIAVPKQFRMICTMNDYDKSLLNDLSYGMLRRFAFVEIDIPKDKQAMKYMVIKRIKTDISFIDKDNKLDSVLIEIDELIEQIITFFYDMSKVRKLGVSTILDIVRYIVNGRIIRGELDSGKLLVEAMIDYIIPQFDRLDVDTLRTVKDAKFAKFNEFEGEDDDGKVNTTVSLTPQLETFTERIQGMLDKLEKLGKIFDNK